MQDLLMGVEEVTGWDQLGMHRRTLGLWYVLGTLLQASRYDWTPEQVGDWLFTSRQATGVLRSYGERWGNGNPWAAAYPYIMRLEVFSRIRECHTDANGVVVRHSPLMPSPGALAARFGMSTELDRLNRHFWKRVGQELGVAVAWEDGDAIRTVRFSTTRRVSGINSQPWRPSTDEVLTQRARREVARSVAGLVALGLHFNYPPERTGRVLATRIGPEALGREALAPWPAPARSLVALAARLHLGLTDGVRIREQDGGWLLESDPVPPEERGLMESYDVLPFQLGRFLNGLLDSLATQLGLRVTCEAGVHVLSTTVRRGNRP